MPLLKLMCTKEVPDDLMKRLASAVALAMETPEEEVMVAFDQMQILMAGNDADAAYAEVKSIGGLDRVVNHELTMKICILLNDHLGIPCERIFVTFQSFEPDHWGWKKSLSE